MVINVKILFKSKVVIILLLFTALTFSGIIFTSVRSLKLDREHLALLEYSKNIDIEVSHSRIYLDDYFLFVDTLKRTEVLKSLETTGKYISALNTLLVEKKEDAKIANLKIVLENVNTNIEDLERSIIDGFQKDIKSIASDVLEEYNIFHQAYLEFDKSFHDFILIENSRFKKEIFVLLLSIFGVLLLSVIYIYRLINAFHTVEKQQAIKTMEVEFKERKRIAADLHDGLGSILSSIVLYVKLIEKDFFNKEVNGNLEQVKQLSTTALENLESAINNLNPSSLNRHGLLKSIDILCERINDIGKVNCNFNTQNFNLSLSQNMEINIYRICNELIHNTLKHAEATEIELEFKNTKKRVSIYYRDNGKGFNTDLIPSNKAEKMGLRNIISRIESFGGTHTIKSRLGEGVEFIIQFNV